jgi:hypothetical protein
LEVETSTLLKTLGKKHAVTQPDPTRVEPEKRRPNPGSDQHLAGPPPKITSTAASSKVISKYGRNWLIVMDFVRTVVTNVAYCVRPSNRSLSPDELADKSLFPTDMSLHFSTGGGAGGGAGGTPADCMLHYQVNPLLNACRTLYGV